MTMNDMSANEQWRVRPADQRFLSLTELAGHCADVMNRSTGKVVPSKGLSADVQAVPGLSGERLVITGPNGSPTIPTNWAFGQLAARAGAPAGYLRELPNALAADCLNYGLHVARGVEDVGVLLCKNGGPLPELHAVTGPNYGRIWSANVANALVKVFGNGVDGPWHVPGEFGVRAAVTKENTTLYASDRDMWAFLCDDSKAIDIPNRRNGKTGHASTGLVFGNSDVGMSNLWVARFLFDYMCGNHIIWGMVNLEELRIRHTSSAPHRFLNEFIPLIRELAADDVTLSQAQVITAQRAKVADLDKFLTSRKFTRPQVGGIKAAFQSDEGRELMNDCSVWDAVVAATAYARKLPYQDARVAIDREAGKMLMAA